MLLRSLGQSPVKGELDCLGDSLGWPLQADSGIDVMTGMLQRLGL